MHADRPVLPIRDRVQAIQSLGARVVESRYAEHGKTGCERGNNGGCKAEREKAVDERSCATSPDPGCACSRDGKEGWNGVDDEAPLLVGLEAVKENEEDVGKQDVASRFADTVHRHSNRNAEVIYQRIEEQARQCGAEVEMKRRYAPLHGFAFDSIVSESVEFRP